MASQWNAMSDNTISVTLTGLGMMGRADFICPRINLDRARSSNTK